MPSIRTTLRAAVMTAALALLCVTAASAESLGIGTVNSDGLRLRAEANTEAEILATAFEGAHAVVREDMGDGWYRVDYDAVEGYMAAEFLDVAVTADAELGSGKVNADGGTLNVRSGPGTDYDRLGILQDGAVVTLTGMDAGWFKIDYSGGVGYVSSDYIKTCKEGAAESSDLGAQIVAYAKQYLGKPYVWGGNGPNGFDCSGFTKYVYAHFGYSINRTASTQLKNGVSVEQSDLQAGDLIFFYNGKDSTPVSHVGIYIGDGDFIHASTNSYTVEIDTLYAEHNAQKYVYARRII